MTSVLTGTLRALDRSATPFMLAGSVASGYYSAPRTTNDLDVVIDPTAEQLERFLALMAGHEWYLDPGAARRALQTRDMFAVIDTSSGWKVDLIVRKQRRFSEVELSRRVPVDFLGVQAYVASREDVILSKLEWALIGGSERQLLDVSAIIEVAAELDDDYLDEWAVQLGVGELLSRVRGR